MSSLAERFELLERDLVARPPRISAYHDLPFAIFRYDPEEEFECRKLIRLRVVGLEQDHRRRVTCISLASLVWKGIRATEGVAAIVSEERELGFERAQKTVGTLLADTDFAPLPDLIADRMKGLDPEVDIVFLVRAGGLAPAIYRCARLLDEMHRRTFVPMILFYPGSLEGTSGLRFFDMQDREDTGTYNYRVRIY